MRRVLLVAATTGYQTRAFEQAAARLGIELVYATDRCHVIEDPWRDHAIPVRFDDEQASVDRVVARARPRPFDGVLAVGDRPTVIAALVAQRLGLRFHTPAGAASARNKLLMRERLRQAGLPTPWFYALDTGRSGCDGRHVSYPCVVKPLDLSGSRGVIRADDPSSFAAACTRAGSIVRSARRESGGGTSSQPPSLLVEAFIEGREFAVEGVMTNGVLQALAIFEKPDPLDGPFFEETIYLTPPSATPSEKRAIVDTVAAAAIALELNDGPVHAECRVNQRGVFILEVAARPIGGLCARVLRFVSRKPAETRSLEELLLHHALGETTTGWRREPAAAGVMMIPIRGRGFFRGVSGAEAARAVERIEDVVVTAKPGQLLVPLPEGSSYLGFIFARAERVADVDCALRASHACLGFDMAQELRMVESGNG